MSERVRLTPQMLAYQEKFADSGEIRWLPYLMYFHPSNFQSPVVNTDEKGFRYSERGAQRYSIVNCERGDAVRLLAGSSTVFGIGASADRWTLPSRLNENDSRPEPWLNFGGRSFNSMQELLLIVNSLHLLPPVREIVLFSGFNNLGLARMPSSMRQEHGAFFNCNQFYDALNPKKAKRFREVAKSFLYAADEIVEPLPTIAEQIKYATDLTVRHLSIWAIFAKALGAKLTYVLQPLSGWVRETGCDEEEALFSELDELGRFTEIYGDILNKEVCSEYAASLQIGIEKLGVRFIDINPILSKVLRKDQWLFVDRIHFTDDGHDFVAKQLLQILR